MKKYDALYIFAGQAKDDVLENYIEKALAEVTRLGGVVVSKEVLGKRAFARPMRKRESGVYVEVRFEIEPSTNSSTATSSWKRFSACRFSPSTSAARRFSLASARKPSAAPPPRPRPLRPPKPRRARNSALEEVLKCLPSTK